MIRSPRHPLPPAALARRAHRAFPGRARVGRRGSGASRAASLAAVVLLGGCGRLVGPEATLGPGAIVRGRGLYNEVIADTDNEQTLEWIVRARYGEPSGLLAVSSVTANLRASATAEGQIGIGPTSNFKGNLVPLALGATYEQNPTISYAPVQGERYVKRLLSPIALDVLVLMLNAERGSGHLLPILVKQVNDLGNPIGAAPGVRARFAESVELLSGLQRDGVASWTATDTKPPAFALLIHGYGAEQGAAVRRLLQLWSLPQSLARGGREIVLPVRLELPRQKTPGLYLQTRSVHDLVDLAATAVQVPPEDAAQGLADPGLDGLSPLAGIFAIQSSAGRPPVDVLVAARHHGSWFYIPANDGPSKLTFRVLQALMNMCLVDAAPQTIPTLTIPVGK